MTDGGGSALIANAGVMWCWALVLILVLFVVFKCLC